MGVYLPSRLPSTYQEVEWIRSSGSQYFDTGFYPTGNSEIEIDFVRESGSDVGTFGVDSGWTNSAFSILNDRIFCYGSKYQAQDQNYYTIGTRYLMKFKNLKCYLNGVEKFMYAQQTFTSSYSAYMFAKRRNNYIEAYSNVTCYSLKLWDNGTLVRDYVPCYRKSDGVIGMYDLVNNTFKTNQGSGFFTKGNDVFPELSNAYIGKYEWQPGANTIAYYPLTSSTTVNDMKGSGTAQNLTNSNVSFGTQFGVDCAYISGNSDSTHSVSKYLYGNISGLPTGNGVRTFSFWIYDNNPYSLSSSDECYLFQGEANSSNAMVLIAGGGIDLHGYLFISKWGSEGAFGTIPKQTRSHNVITYDGSKFEWYVNGANRGTWTTSINTQSNRLNIFGTSENVSWNGFNGAMSNLILENKARTEDEVATYYKLTKSNYGL